MPMPFARNNDNRIAGFEILRGTAVYLNTHPSLDDEEPLRTGVLVPVRSSPVREFHPVHADGNASLIMCQSLNRGTAEEGCRIDWSDRRGT